MVKVDMKGRPVKTSTRRWWILAVVVLASGAAWAGWHYTHRSTLDPAVAAKLAEIREQLSPAAGVALSPEQRRKLMDDMHKQVEQLPPEQRQQLREQGREAMHKEIENRAKEFFALPLDQRTAALDKAIDEMEQHRRAWQQSRPQQARGAQAGGPQGNRGPNPAGQGRSLNQDQQVARRVNRLNSSSPEVRAYFQQLMQRRQQRGLPGFGRPH